MLSSMTVVSEQDWEQAREHIFTAMSFVERIFEEEAEEHARDFVWQMREVLGRPAIILNSHFLPFEQARASLWLLVALEKIEAQLHRPGFVPQREEDEEGRILKAFNPREPLRPQVEMRVAVEIERHRDRFRQRLDRERQESLGLTHYVWETAGDDRVRASHEANHGKTFAWDDPPATGHPGEDWGCRCRAIPSPEDAQLPDDPPIEPVYPIEELLIILARIRIAIRIARRIYEKLKKQQPQKREISKEDLNASQKENLTRFEKKLPKDAEPTKITKNADESVVFESDVPARNVPGSYAKYEKTVDASGRTTGYTKTTYDADGNVVHVKDKMGEP